MTLKEFAKIAAQEREGRVSKWIRRRPIASRILLGSSLAGAISAKKGQRTKSFLKGMGGETIGALAAMPPGAIAFGQLVKGVVERSKKRSIPAALAYLASAAGGKALGIHLSRRWQKKHEKTGPTK